ncbi:MAG: glycosyltransferase [Thermoguttaceae bacterium]|nr:glycosyltransferase [Thermoguttaceae bacterium]
MSETSQCIKEPIVSIIVPIYNTADYLRECLDSIIAQTLKEIEIICVDDGSTDKSPDILEEYHEKDARVIVVSQINQGVSVARNTGVAVAKGKYIHFVDSDDCIDPDMCRRTVEIAEKYKADVTRFYNARDLKLVCKRFPKTRSLFDKRLREYYDTPTQDDRRLFVYLSGFHGCWTCLYLRSFWLDAKLKFPEGIRYGEDTYVNYIAYAVGKQFAFFEANLYRYRQRVGSAAHPKTNAMLGSFVDAFDAYRKTRDFYTQFSDTESLCEPLAEIFAYMQRNLQTPLSKSERAIWREHIDELLDNQLRQAFYERGALPAQIRSFWLGLYGRNVFERTFNAAYSEIFIRLKRLEAFGKKHVIRPFRKKSYFRKTTP